MPTLSDIGRWFNPLEDTAKQFALKNGLSDAETDLLLKYVNNGGVKGRGAEKEQAIIALCEEFGISRERFSEILNAWSGKTQ